MFAALVGLEDYVKYGFEQTLWCDEQEPVGRRIKRLIRWWALFPKNQDSVEEGPYSNWDFWRCSLKKNFLRLVEMVDYLWV